MKPILTVEFKAQCGDAEFEEENISFHTLEQLFEFVAPGGGCEKIPDEVDEIQMVFLPAEHPNSRNPIADAHATLGLGIVLFSGPLAEINQLCEQLLDKAGRAELSDSFLKVIDVTG
jgi:hypothetical protein